MRRLFVVFATAATLGGLASVAPASAQREIHCVRECSPVPYQVQRAVEELTRCADGGGLCLPPG